MKPPQIIATKRPPLARGLRWAATVLVAAAGGLLAQSTNGGGVGSTNLDRLTHFWNAVENSRGPVTVLAFGDSMSVQYQGLQNHLFTRLQARLGDAGFAYVDTYNRISASLSGGAEWWNLNGATTPLWWSDVIALPPASSVAWADQYYGGAAISCDQVGVFWIAHPGGGAFHLSITTERGVWRGPVLILDGYAPQPVSRYTNTPLARASYWLRAEGVSGTNLILSPQLLHRTGTGIRTAYLAKNGANLNQILSLSTNLTYPILAALNPQLVVWHMKELELGETGLSNRLCDLEAFWQATAPASDVVYVGTPYEYRDGTEPLWTPTHNRFVRQAAVRDGRGYVDCMTPCGSFHTMALAGYMNDGIHPNNAGYAFLAASAWRELTWAALRVDRRLAIQSGADGPPCLTWPTVTNLNYEVQASTDLLNWSPIHTTPGDGARHAFTNHSSSAGSRAFRLKLTGN